MDDNFNGKNNIVTVKKSDFEVMDALAMDIQNQAPKSITNSNYSNNYYLFICLFVLNK